MNAGYLAVIKRKKINFLKYRICESAHRHAQRH